MYLMSIVRNPSGTARFVAPITGVGGVFDGRWMVHKITCMRVQVTIVVYAKNIDLWLAVPRVIIFYSFYKQGAFCLKFLYFSMFFS